MAHKFVSTKDVMKNEGFLAKLGSTLAGRLNPDPLIETKAKSSITWRRTSDIKHRIKTATGTIAIYEDLTPEQLAEKQAEADRAAGGIAPDSAGPAPAATLEEEGAKEPALPTPTATPAAAADATAAGKQEWWMEEMEEAGIGVGEAVRRAEKRTESVMQEQEGAEPGMTTTTTTTSTTTTTFTFLANEDYAPEDDDGLQVVSGQILTLIDKSSPHKRPRLEEGEGGATHLLDNSAAKHKMAIRPKRNHPDPRSRGHDTGEERWVMRDEDSGKEGLVPSRLLSPHAETTTTALRSSLKRTVQQIAKEEPLEVKQSLMKEIREYKSRKLSSRQLLGPSPEDEARAKRTATIRELVETEDEFVKDLQFVVENYYDLLDDPNTPRVIRDQKELIFNNFKRIAEFHQNVLIEGVKYHAEVPTMIGRTFLRLERDFDRHAEYCTNEPLAQEFMENNLTVKEFFEEQSQQLGDDKRLQEHLKLPIQRLNDYQLLLKELVKYSSRLGDDTNDLQKAHELMQTIPQRATDAKFINSIEGFKGNLYKLGRLVRHDWFTVKEEGQKARERYLFLFKARILVTKVKRISEDRSIFILRDIIRLPETSLGSLDNPKALEFLHIEPHAHPNYPIRIEARTAEIRESWLAGVEEYVVDTASVEDLLFDDELRVVSQEADEEDAKVSSSPIPEGQDYEELPEDEDQRAQSVKKAKREEEKPKEEEEGEQDFWAEWEETFEGKKSSKEQLEQEAKRKEEEEKTRREQEKKEKEEKERQEREAKEKKTTEEKQRKEKEEKEKKEKEEKEKKEKEEKERKEQERLKKEKEEKERKEREEKEKKEKEEKERKEKERLEKEKEEKERKEREEKEKKEREEKERKEKEEKERKEKEEKARKEKEEKERKEKEEKERLRKEKEEKEKKEKEEKERLRKEKEEKERKEKEEKERKEREEKARKEKEEKERKEKEERERKEKEEKERKEKEEKERLRKEKEEKERKEKEEKERKEREEKERKEREEKERLKKEKEEKEKKEREEKLKKEKEEKERKEKEEKERKAKEEKERKEREEKERKEKEEKERLRKEKEEKERKEKEEKARKEKEEKERKEREEKERKEKEEKERKEKEEKERLKKEKEEKERKEKEEKERLRKEKEEKERKEKEEKERKEKEEKARKEKEEKERKEKEEKERKEREEKERLKKEKEEKERKEKEEKERKEREEKLRKEKEEKERKEKEEKERKEKEEKERLRKEKEEKERKEKEEKERKEREEKERLKKEKEEKERKEKEEKARKEKEEKERKEREEKERLKKEKEEKERKEKEEKERKEREEKLRKEKEEKERKEKEEKERKEKEEKERLRKEKEEKERKEKEEKERKEKEEKERKEREEKERLIKEKEEKERKEKEEKERLRKEKEEKERKEKEEKERKEKEEKARKEKEEKERKEKEEKERLRKEKEEKERKEKEEKERKEREEKLKKEKEEKERKEKEEKERKEKEEKERLRKEKEEKERKEREEKERKEKEERERKAKEEKERKEKEEKLRKEKEEKERKEKEEKERKEKEEKERKEKEEKERLKKEKEEKERKEKEEKLRKEKEEKERKEKEEKERLRKEKEEKERKEKEEKERKEKEEKERLRKEKEEKERKEREEKARKEKEEKERKEREEKARKEKEEKEKKEREEKLRKEKEEKERKEREEKERKEKEEKERLRKEKEEKERKEKEEKERKEREEKERKEKEEKERLRKEKEEKERKEREAKEKKEKEEKERLRKEKEEKERKEKEEQERLKKEKEEKERKEKEEKERKEKEAKLKKEKEEKERKEKEEKERKEKEEKERKEKEAKLKKEKEEKEKKEREEKERKEKEEKERKEKEEKERKENEAKLKKEKEEKEKKEKEEKEKKEKEAKLKKEKEEKEKEKEEKEKKEKEEKEKKEKEAKLKKEKEEKEKKEKEEKEKKEKEAKLKKEKEEKEKKEKEEKEKKEKEAKLKKEKEEKEKEEKEKKEKEAKLKKEKEEKEKKEKEEKEKKTKEEKERKEKEMREKKEGKATGGKPQASGGKPKVTLPKPEEKAKKGATMEEPSTPFTPGGTPKPVFTKTLKGDIVEPGEDVAFVCEVTHPLPYFITWLKDNKPLDDKLADRVQQQDSGSKHTLRVLNCRIDDSGIYTAKATDEANSSSTCSAQLLVQEFTEEERARRYAEKSPFFLVRMKPTEVIENTNLSYTIHVKGDPMPEVQFLKDEQDIVEDERVTIHRDQQVGHYELLISHVQKEDEGVYKCVARNRFGKAECDAQMTVSDEKLVFQALSGKGSLLATGEKAEFKWFRDGQEFDPLERFNVMFKDDEDTLALVFQNVTPEDAGLYTCVASTSCGKISCSAELTVEGSINRLLRDPEPPSIKEEMTDTTVSIGGSAMLECKIGGYPKPELKWTKNGLDLEIGGRMRMLWEDEESVAFVIKNVEERDAGLYRVVVTNDLGEADCSAKLAIRAGPKIKKLLKEVACVVGQNLEYNIEVQGEPAPQVHIMVDGRPVESTDRVSLKKVSDTLWTFTIKGMVAGDCGTYTVVAANEVGQVSDFFTVATDSAPQITRDLDPETEKKLNMDVTLEVRATGSPKPDARWYKNGKEIMADERFKMTRDDTFYILKIRHVERKDKGTYKCVLTNTSGEASTQGDLLVRAPPDFVTPLKDVCAKEGSKDVKLFVEWEANPPPTVKWFFKDRPVREDTEGYAIRGAQDTSQILCILQATPDFVGQYTVKAANEYGESTCKGRFRLHEPPSILQSLKDTEFLEFEASKFLFKAIGVPQPDVKWTKDGKKWTPDERRVRLKLEGEETYILIFEEALTVDSGHYVATVSNVEGTVTTEATLTVNTPPHIKGCNFNEGKTLIAHHKFLLEVEATSVPEAEATWYLDGKELPNGVDGVKLAFDGKKYTLERVGSDPEHSGEYKCVLKNKIAEGEEKGNITVKEKESRVRNKLEDVYVKEHTDAVIKCQIVGDPIPEVQWLRDGKPLPMSEKFEVSCERMAGWHTLVIKNVKEGDKCSFSVKGKNQHGECETTCRMGVLVKPAPGPLEDAVVDFGKDLYVSLTIHAFPAPTMVWTLNGQELKDGEHYEYTRNESREEYGIIFHGAALDDAGKLAFTASNDAGSETKSCLVRVHYETPTVVGGLEDTGFCLESDGTLTFRASGLPLPECHWTKNGIPLKNDNKHDITNPEPGVYCLTIKDVDQYDFGEVAVVAKSLVGECESKAKLSQKMLECSFVEALENLTNGPEGDDLTLSVTVRGSPRPKFVWTKNGDEVEASAKFKISSKKNSYCEATINLTIVEASAIDSGQYRLKCYNDVSEITTETALVVRPERRKPKVTKKPQELQVMEHQPGVFQAKIIGFPKPEVKWLKDGRQVYHSDVIDLGVTAEGIYYLEFRGVTQEDMGRYTVHASNDLGSCEADTQLTVVPPPSKPEFLSSLRSSKVILGYPVRLEVKLGGSPRPEVQWLKDGQPINLDGKHYKQVEGPDGTVCLQIDAATEGDAGEISCVAKNPEGDSTSKATLSVLGFTREDGQPDSPAKFTEGLKDISADEGDTLRLPVTMKGGPVPKMKWYKDGKEIKLGDRVFFTYDGDRKEAFLEVRPAQGEDSGMYKCVIENDHGKAETECEVSIRKCFEPPCFTSTFTNQYKLPGSDVRMTVKYDGLPLPEITWYHDNEKIGSDGDRVRVRKDGEGQTLLIRDATYSDAGVYRVVAKNREGTVEYKAELFVSDDIDPRRRMEAPVFLKVIGDQEVFEGSKALFKAIVMGKPEPEFRWYKDNSPIISTNRVAVEKDNDGLIRLSIRHVTTEDAGVYQLKAWNEYGEAACSGKLICETLTSKKKRPVGDEYQGFDRIRRSGVPMPLPDKPMISALSDRRATISWMPHLAAPPTQPVTYLLEMAEYPEGDWNTVRTGIRGCSVDVSNLLPKSDYRFRVRVANKHGVSEPSPYVLTYRHKLELPPITYEPWMDPNYEYKGEGPYVPEGFRINRDNRGNYYAAPRFLRLEHDTQYGMRGFNASLKWYAYGYPLPKVQFFRNDLPLDVGRKGSRYTYSHDATGAICLFVDRMTEGDIGLYDCLVTNEYGQSRQRLRLDLSEYPRVLQPLEELHLRANSSGKIMCRISGYPACDVKWFRDWEPLPSSYKFRPSFLEPDWYILTINGASVKDAGLYSVAAVNVAGSVHSSCMVHIEDDDIGFYWTGPGMGRKVGINSRRGTLEDHYDIGDELGRGTQGVSYHCVEHHTGRNFVAKSMWGKDNFKQWMRNEFDMMNHINTCKNIVRLYDAYESVNNMVLVTELCGGGDLLGTLTQRTYITEYEVCWYVRQLLLAADHMHDRCMAHLGINVGDILLVRPNGMEIKLGDLSLARNIRIQNVYPLDYGMPEFVAPEVANGEGVTYATDMWAIGVVTYILLSGISPFRGENDRETLTKVKKGEVNFDRDAFAHISGEAKDFILKLLDYKVDTRMEAKTALRHPWMSLASSMPRDPYRITTDRLRSYYSRFREWYANASCKRWFRRRTLSSCFSHPSKMVYPPGELYTPPESPEREIIPAKPAEDYHIPERDLSYTLDVFKNESNYQMGPDTYLLQLKDVEFPCRLRSYMKVAEDRSPSFAMSLRENDFDYSVTKDGTTTSTTSTTNKSRRSARRSAPPPRPDPTPKPPVEPIRPAQFLAWRKEKKKIEGVLARRKKSIDTLHLLKDDLLRLQQQDDEDLFEDHLPPPPPPYIPGPPPHLLPPPAHHLQHLHHQEQERQHHLQQMHYQQEKERFRQQETRYSEGVQEEGGLRMGLVGFNERVMAEARATQRQYQMEGFKTSSPRSMSPVRLPPPSASPRAASPLTIPHTHTHTHEKSPCPMCGNPEYLE